MAIVKLQLKPIQTPNFVQVERPPAQRGEGMKEGLSIPVKELDLESLTELAEDWLTELYAKAGQKPNWNFLKPKD